MAFLCSSSRSPSPLALCSSSVGSAIAFAADQERIHPCVEYHGKSSLSFISQPCRVGVAAFQALEAEDRNSGAGAAVYQSFMHSTFGRRDWIERAGIRARRFRAHATQTVDAGQSEQTECSTAFLQDGRKRRKRVFLVDVHPLCYEGSKPSARAFVEWIRLLLSQVTHEDPVIAVMDGEKGNMRRRSILPSYKAKRNKYTPFPVIGGSGYGSGYGGEDVDLRQAFPCIRAFFHLCNIPVVKVEDAEADDVVASLTYLATKKGLDVVIASPDMDFKQLLAENVQLVLPVQELHRWSFYTLQLYITQHRCHPSCLLGDRTDCVPGLSELAPGFGHKTALKLMRKHGSLEALLEAAAVRTVGKAYVQDALTKYAPVLYRNSQVLSLQRDIKVAFEEKWCLERDAANDTVAIATLEQQFQKLQQSNYHGSYQH
ncbi:hypothetical protein O6H91_09G030500 [Diphasiastrum complanatum]|uniref:Uncharacterized protein n=1 Tax=Diphasiastrum complanatum TaxID=34168 RepID=A0ACC2CMJ6_DIPCM|nr:hypothetical protein O6H91_09G030500 [Diphasiastrum complanatum]